jgi:hypothetical protein
MTGLRPAVSRALRLEAPEGVFWSVQGDGRLVLMNFTDDGASVSVPPGKTLWLEPYTIAVD